MTPFSKDIYIKNKGKTYKDSVEKHKEIRTSSLSVVTIYLVMKCQDNKIHGRFQKS